MDKTNSMLKTALHTFKIILLLFIILGFVPNIMAQKMSTRQDSIVMAFSKETDPIKKEALLKVWESAIPPSAVNGYDWPRLLLAQSFAINKNFEKSFEYVMKMDTLFFRADGLFSVGRYMLKAGDTTRAIKLYKRSISSAESFRDADPKTISNNAAFAKATYIIAVSEYFKLLYKMNNFEEAADYAKLVDKYQEKKDSTFYLQHAKTLLALNRNAESLVPLEKYIIAGGNEHSMPEKLKIAYLAAGKPENEFKKYFKVLKIEQEKVLKSVGELKAAPDFKLKDMDGKIVSLSALKGKVVILDFWATWCGPCLKSFPSMQKAVSHYKADKDVVFLFIDTFEKIPDYEEKAKQLITSAKYDFKVLFDPKDKATGKYLTADSYDVKNIPTKILIDRKGKVRISLAGFSGDDEESAKDLISKIESLKKS